ncbi:hypothetical protein Tco_0110724 [Tanacetum coccineum]
MTKFLAIETLYPSLLHYLTAYSLPSPSNSHCPLIPKLPNLIIILVPWRSIHILVSRVRRSSEVVVACSGSLSSLEADSDGGVIGLAIYLPLYLVDALDLVENDCFDGGDMICKILMLDNKDLDIVKQHQQVLMGLHSWLFSQHEFH